MNERPMEIESGPADPARAAATEAAPASSAGPNLPAPDAAFDEVRALFLRADYTESAVARRLGGHHLAGVPRLVDGRKSLNGDVTDANAALIRLFIDDEPLEAALVRSLVGNEAFEALQVLSLLAPDPGDDRRVWPTVALTPLQGLWLASDLLPRGDRQRPPARDFVYGVLSELTAFFLSVVPDAAGARVLELCAGTGVAALRAAAHGAASAVASDLVPRSVHFARFNAKLNALEDLVRVVESDAWDALGDETFDLVVAHPPYVPALSHQYDFRDAGLDGERVTRRIFEGAPSGLARGGRLIVRGLLSDRRGAPIAQRIRQWLGDSAHEFDLVQLESSDYGLFEAYKRATKGGQGFVDCELWLRHFDDLEIERFALCVIELRREAYGRAPVTERRTLGATASPDVADWVFRWARFRDAAGETAAARLRGQTPRVAAGVRTAVHLESQADGGWATVGATIETAWPTRNLVKAPALAPTLLELCDGSREVAGILAGLRGAGLVDDGVGTEEVAHLVEVLAAAGAVVLPSCPIPPPPGPNGP